MDHMGKTRQAMPRSFRRALRTSAGTLAAAFTCVLAACTTNPSDAVSVFDTTKLQQDIDVMVKSGVVGVQAEVVDAGRRLDLRGGVAQLETNEPVPRQGYFRMGSNTKTFTATVVLQMAGEGKLSLDDTVEKWLPELVTGNGNNGSKITVRQLLQHTSGLHEHVQALPAMASEKGFQKHREDDYQPEQLSRVSPIM